MNFNINELDLSLCVEFILSIPIYGVIGYIVNCVEFVKEVCYNGRRGCLCGSVE